MHDFSILKTAGITPGITAKLVGVSRVTASQWCNGHSQPHRLLGNKVQEYLKLVRLAVDQGRLPLKDYPGKRALLTTIAAAVRDAALTQLK